MKKKWLFYASDFQTLMYPCFTVCGILGMFPYKMNASTFEISLPCYALSSVVVGIYCVYYLLLIHDIINSEVIIYEDVIVCVNAVCYFTFNGLIAIGTHILSKPRMHLLETISKIYLKLPPASHRRLSRFIHIKDILGIIVIVGEILLFFTKWDLKEMGFWDFAYRIIDIYLEMIGFQMNMLYMNCIFVLKACFKKINDDLMHMQSDMINNMKPSVASLICHMRKNQLFLIEIKTLMKQHLIISKAVRKLNLIFTLQLLATVILILSRIIIVLYDNMVNWQDGLQIHFNMNFFDLFVVLIMHNTLKILLTIWACETSKNQAQNISTTICNVLNTTRDRQIKDELQLFCLQVLHHENTFSVKGLTVDATLVTTIVGRSSMYVFLLIQFLIMSHSCDGKSVINTLSNTSNFVV